MYSITLDIERVKIKASYQLNLAYSANYTIFPQFTVWCLLLGVKNFSGHIKVDIWYIFATTVAPYLQDRKQTVTKAYTSF